MVSHRQDQMKGTLARQPSSKLLPAQRRQPPKGSQPLGSLLAGTYQSRRRNLAQASGQEPLPASRVSCSAGVQRR